MLCNKTKSNKSHKTFLARHETATRNNVKKSSTAVVRTNFNSKNLNSIENLLDQVMSETKLLFARGWHDVMFAQYVWAIPDENTSRYPENIILSTIHRYEENLPSDNRIPKNNTFFKYYNKQYEFIESCWHYSLKI